VSPETDRIAAPTNGKRPPALPEPAIPAASERAGPPTGAPFGPTQLAVGFGILAAVIALVAASLRRRGRPARRGPFGRR
jgi:hypothetical protein